MAARYTYDERRWNQVLLRGEAAYLGSQGNFWLHYTKLTIRYRERWR